MSFSELLLPGQVIGFAALSAGIMLLPVLLWRMGDGWFHRLFGRATRRRRSKSQAAE